MPGASANDSAAAPLATETGSPEPGFATHRIEASAQASASETAKPVPTRVKVGVFFISGGKVDFVSSSVALDFYVWLTFTGSSTPQFEFLNSRNFQLSKLEEKMPAPGTNLNYSIFRCSGIFDQDFGLRNYPFDNFTLQILLEDTEQTIGERLYFPDVAESGIDPLFHLIGWDIDEFRILSREHPYKTTFGDPTSTTKETYSQVEVEMRISRDPRIIFVKMVIPAILFLMISVIGILLPIEQISQRISLSVASLFSSVAYHLSLSQGLPPISYLTFVDKMMLGNYFTIFINILLTVFIFLAGKSGRQRLELFLSRTSWIVIPVIAGTIIIRLALRSFFN